MPASIAYITIVSFRICPMLTNLQVIGNTAKQMGGGVSSFSSLSITDSKVTNYDHSYLVPGLSPF